MCHSLLLGRHNAFCIPFSLADNGKFLSSIVTFNSSSSSLTVVVIIKVFRIYFLFRDTAVSTILPCFKNYCSPVLICGCGGLWPFLKFFYHCWLLLTLQNCIELKHCIHLIISGGLNGLNDRHAWLRRKPTIVVLV